MDLSVKWSKTCCLLNKFKTYQSKILTLTNKWKWKSLLQKDLMHQALKTCLVRHCNRLYSHSSLVTKRSILVGTSHQCLIMEEHSLLWEIICIPPLTISRINQSLFPRLHLVTMEPSTERQSSHSPLSLSKTEVSFQLYKAVTLPAAMQTASSKTFLTLLGTVYSKT